jgi:sulfur relay (sulfurtransferase) complex TusBCD TusD component (DsrE family)
MDSIGATPWRHARRRRGLTEPELVEGTRRSSLDELTEWTLWADRIIVF